MPWMPRQKQNIGWMPFSDKHILPVHNSLSLTIKLLTYNRAVYFAIVLSV